MNNTIISIYILFIIIYLIFYIISYNKKEQYYKNKIITEQLIPKRDKDRFNKISDITKKGGTGGSKLGTNILGIVKLLLLSFEDGFYLIDSAIALPNDIRKEPKIKKITKLPSVNNVFI